MNKSINVGLAIEQRINELGITKSEFGRRIGIPNQNVNRVLSKSSIDSDKLVEICNALNYDFFKLFSSSVEENKTSLLRAKPNKLSGHLRTSFWILKPGKLSLLWKWKIST